MSTMAQCFDSHGEEVEDVKNKGNRSDISSGINGIDQLSAAFGMQRKKQCPNRPFIWELLLCFFLKM
jgi:hypothetical protein